MSSNAFSRADRAFSRAERALIARLNTPAKVQRWLNALPYNTEKGGETQHSFRPVVRLGTAHCMEAALFAAVVLEQHGYPPLVMSLESQDWLDHVIFIYQHDGRWGSVARSRDPGLHGRKPVFRSPRALARSYMDAYVDYTGRMKGFGVANLAEAMGNYDWRFTEKSVWKVEQMLIDLPAQEAEELDRGATGSCCASIAPTGRRTTIGSRSTIAAARSGSPRFAGQRAN